MIDNWFAAAVLVMCVALFARLLIGERRRLRLDAALGRAFAAVRRGWHIVRRWPAQRRQARRDAEAAIERARRGAEREGNVYRPKSFDHKRPPRDKLH